MDIKEGKIFKCDVCGREFLVFTEQDTSEVEVYICPECLEDQEKLAKENGKLINLFDYKKKRRK